ncbi:hypothetical protein QJS10_CPA08g01813 [Acorus calamus]|uniref:DNA-3-methyladenine glycosylase I n=1 Tax=Acorus calamus TaxID=4465 RepID=A0AAV9EA25_ACOCL|nr:hypothetical protein QJS10_CPA08g01813 [Acorus calamus]
MPTQDLRRYHISEKALTLKENDKKPSKAFLSKNLQKVYPIGFQKSVSGWSLSSFALLQSSNATLFDRPNTRWGVRTPGSVGRVGSIERRDDIACDGEERLGCRDGELRRCNWITKSSEKYILDVERTIDMLLERSDHQKRSRKKTQGRDRYQEGPRRKRAWLVRFKMEMTFFDEESSGEVFSRFDANVIANMEENDIMEVSSMKKLMLREIRVRCIVNNARCVLKVVEEFGSFSAYLWSYVSYKPIINGYKNTNNIPMRTPKSEAMSRDMVNRGFRLVGPTIIQSFMQASGMTHDHLSGCFRKA